MVKKLFHSFFNSKWPVLLIALFYIVSILATLPWGVPNENHPFNYIMDEWHQLQGVRSVFKEGSNNVSGAAHGPMFHFIFSGLYLGLLTLLGIVDPFSINSSLTELSMQGRIFIAFRLNTLIFGLLTLFILYKISRLLKISPLLSVGLYVVNPVFLFHSLYFKYDIALAFWVTLFIYLSLRFLYSPSRILFLTSGIALGLATATKITALPLLISYVITLFSIRTKSILKIYTLLLGFFLFFITVVLFGFSDVLLQKGDYTEFLYSNLVGTPQIYSDFILPINEWFYLLFIVWPLDFGYLLFVLSVTGFIYLVIQILHKSIEWKQSLFLLISIAVILLSMIPLRVGATGNRVIIVLPFLVLISSVFFTRFFSKVSSVKIGITVYFSIALLLIQLHQSYAVLMSRWVKDPREISSEWIVHSIPKGSEIGIENIPIYQSLPDIILKEYYEIENNSSLPMLYKYKVIDSTAPSIPKIVVITDHTLERNYLSKSPKKSLILRLEKEGYTIRKEYKATDELYKVLGNELNFYTTGIVGTHSIAIYEKK